MERPLWKSGIGSCSLPLETISAATALTEGTQWQQAGAFPGSCSRILHNYRVIYFITTAMKNILCRFYTLSLHSEHLQTGIPYIRASTVDSRKQLSCDTG
jgi:hypothetical protein